MTVIRVHRRGLDQSPEKSHPECFILRSLGMPLNAHVESSLEIRDALDDTIGRRRDHFERTPIKQCLMMMTGDAALQRRSFDLMDRIIQMVVSGRNILGEVLAESRPVADPHELHAQTDPQDRKVAIRFQRGQDREFEVLTQPGD